MRALSQREAFILFTVLLCISVVIVHFFPDVGNTALINVVVLAIMTTTIVLLCLWDSYCCCLRENVAISILDAASPHGSLNPDASLEHLIPKSNDPVISTAPRQPRLHYLDNIKSVLTTVVVVHHITCSFVGSGWMYMIGDYRNTFQIFGVGLLALDQSYFMAFFFFISGYFTPSSYDRKGVNGFLKGKFKRLALPFLTYFYVVGPLLDLFIHKVALRHFDSNWFYAPNPGPPWFLAWLLIFNSAYVFIGGNNVELSRPTFRRLLIFGFLCGLVQGLLIFLIPTGSFVMMPLTYGSLPFDIMFFAGGIIAKRNGWLDNPIPSAQLFKGQCHMVTWSLTMFVIFALVYVYVPSSTIFPAAPHGGHKELGSEKSVSVFVTLVVDVLIAGGMGFYCIVLSFGMFSFFQKRCNYSNRCTKFFSDAAYTVYLIHPWIIVPITWSYVILLKKIGNVDVIFPLAGSNSSTTTSSTDLGNDGLLWFGWVYTSICSLLLVWPLSWSLRQLPGLNKIL